MAASQVIKNYEVIKAIGEGSFGRALLVKNKEGEKLVMKEIKMQKVTIVKCSILVAMLISKKCSEITEVLPNIFNHLTISIFETISG